MRILVVYGTTEGQTGKIAGFVSERLTRQGHGVMNVNTCSGGALPDPGGFDAILIAASVHLGRYQAAVIEFVRRHRAAISERANAFLSVSLSAAGHEPDDIGGLEKCVANFDQASGWRQELAHHAAGAFRYSAYRFLTRYVMKYKAYRRGAPTDTHNDYELTDWDDVARFADTFASARTVTR